MFDKIKEIEDRFEQLENELSRPEIFKDQNLYKKFSKEHSDLSPIVDTYRRYISLKEEIKSNKLLMDDPDQEIRKLAREEAEVLESEVSLLGNELKLLLLPKDPNDEKNIILEIRAGTGGEEAALFAADLLRLYLKYAELRKWKTEILSRNITGKGG